MDCSLKEILIIRLIKRLYRVRSQELDYSCLWLKFFNINW